MCVCLSTQAMEPIFSVALSTIFLGDKPDPLVLITLIPIMGGVAMASVSEVGVTRVCHVCVCVCVCVDCIHMLALPATFVPSLRAS